MNEVKKIWLDGEFVDWQNAKIHILTHTLHYGGGVFEGIRTYETKNGPAVFRLKEHIDRFFYSASCLDMKIPFTKEEIEKAILETIKVNEVKECYIRPLAFFGYGNMGLNPLNSPVSVSISLWPWRAYLESGKPIKVKISKYRRLDPQSVISDAKVCGYYVNSILATLDAQKSGFAESLLLDSDGYVAEGPGENVFMIKDNKVYTPSLGSILAGITRDSCIKIFKDLGFEVIEKKISPEEIKEADEVFLTGTAAEVCPVGQIDDALINNGEIGKITENIKNIYKKTVKGEEEKYLNWLTFVK
jgi:branched-chain amino acid aminotransferase